MGFIFVIATLYTGEKWYLVQGLGWGLNKGRCIPKVLNVGLT